LELERRILDFRVYLLFCSESI